MERYELIVYVDNEGAIHVDMEDHLDGEWVRHDDAKQAIAAAVHAERRRVWDALADEYHRRRWDGQFIALPAWAISFLFPDGEPKTESTIGEDEVHTCDTCGRRMDIVRPGKWQCPECD